MKYFVFLLFYLLGLTGFAQTTIKGTVHDKSNEALIGVNITILETYDGGITDENGQFEFQTFETGTQKIQFSYLGYQTKEIDFNVAELSEFKIILKESTQSLDAVEITASTFKAGDNSKVAVLKPLDIVTTAGSMGDVMAALQTLPGTQSNAEDGRLFVRGGAARETSIYIDGMKVFSPYTRTVQGTPSRGRYSPFLFKGISFNTGGYDPSFGQALSGILDMNTTDVANETETNISLMTVGLGLGHTQKGDKHSISFSGSYIDLTPYFWLVNSRLDWEAPFRGISAEAVYRYKTSETGLFKSYIAGDQGKIKLYNTDLNNNARQLVDINNSNIYNNNTYRNFISDKTSILVGISTGVNYDQFVIDENFMVDSKLFGLHGKLSFKTIFKDNLIADYGIESIYQQDDINTTSVNTGEIFSDQLGRYVSASYGSMDYFFNKNLALKGGLRIENNSLLGTTDFLPRFTLAQKISSSAQVSLSAGKYSQEIESEYLYYNKSVVNEQATHYLMNFNYKTDKHILRAETYYKDYSNLLSFIGDESNPSLIGNEGYGTAYGLDLFWRANQMIKYVDFWVSYSWLNHERKFQNYPSPATPQFSTEHNLSLVSKIWMQKLKSSLGLTYQYASGRPYENPNTVGFLNERSNPFHNISASWAYLISQQKILFFSVSNAPGFKNEFGYRYANAPDATGVYPGEIIRPSEDQFFFVGFFVTISDDKNKNQLDNL